MLDDEIHTFCSLSRQLGSYRSCRICESERFLPSRDTGCSLRVVSWTLYREGSSSIGQAMPTLRVRNESEVW